MLHVTKDCHRYEVRTEEWPCPGRAQYAMVSYCSASIQHMAAPPPVTAYKPMHQGNSTAPNAAQMPPSCGCPMERSETMATGCLTALLRPAAPQLSEQPLYARSNGITVCYPGHLQVHWTGAYRELSLWAWTSYELLCCWQSARLTLAHSQSEAQSAPKTVLKA